MLVCALLVGFPLWQVCCCGILPNEDHYDVLSDSDDNVDSDEGKDKNYDVVVNDDDDVRCDDG